ncbi:MAG TPA: hypothetical protein VLQ45_23445, partial [Thermoanaerobaculia bacterium]|nr:hypothetical protein [Thermoanaerobaculia bacterium]
MTTSDIRPPDLEMRVRIVPDNGQTRLIYTLHSPAGVAPFTHKEIEGPKIQGDPERFHTYLQKKLDLLGDGLDLGDEKLLRAEIERKLASLGHQLWNELVPSGFGQHYRIIRSTVRTWMIVTDEPWIPWELIKPYDDSLPENVIDDDFLGRKFQLTRWLAGSKPPSLEIEIRRLAAIRTDKTLPQSDTEGAHLTGLALRSGVDDASPRVTKPGALLSFFETGGTHLLHFIGHGTFEAGQADESAIPLPSG